MFFYPFLLTIIISFLLGTAQTAISSSPPPEEKGEVIQESLHRYMHSHAYEKPSTLRTLYIDESTLLSSQEGQRPFLYLNDADPMDDDKLLRQVKEGIGSAGNLLYVTLEARYQGRITGRDVWVRSPLYRGSTEIRPVKMGTPTRSPSAMDELRRFINNDGCVDEDLNYLGRGPSNEWNKQKAKYVKKWGPGNSALFSRFRSCFEEGKGKENYKRNFEMYVEKSRYVQKDDENKEGYGVHSEVDAIDFLLKNLGRLSRILLPTDVLPDVFIIKFHSYNDNCSKCQGLIVFFKKYLEEELKKAFGRRIPLIFVNVANSVYDNYLLKETGRDVCISKKTEAPVAKSDKRFRKYTAKKDIANYVSFGFEYAVYGISYFPPFPLIDSMDTQDAATAPYIYTFVMVSALMKEFEKQKNMLAPRRSLLGRTMSSLPSCHAEDNDEENDLRALYY